MVENSNTTRKELTKDLVLIPYNEPYYILELGLHKKGYKFSKQSTNLQFSLSLRCWYISSKHKLAWAPRRITKQPDLKLYYAIQIK